MHHCKGKSRFDLREPCSNLTNGFSKFKPFEELSRFREDPLIFMLRITQGKLPLSCLKDQLAYKNEIDSLRILLEAAVHSPVHIRRRAQIALFHLCGFSTPTIMLFLGLSRNTVKRYIHLYQNYTLDKLLNSKREAIKKAKDPSLREKVLALLHSPPSEYGIHRTSWTGRLLYSTLQSQGYNVGRDSVYAILKNADYRWHKPDRLTSNDPTYREKVDNIKNILGNLGPNDRFFSIDEFGPFSVKQRGGRRWAMLNDKQDIPLWQHSRGVLIMTAALEMSKNQVTHFYSKNKDSFEMIRLTRILIHKFRGCRKIYLMWDSASWHSSGLVLDELFRINSLSYRKEYNTPRVEIAPLPAHAQFLNVIESIFSGMVSAVIDSSDYQSVSEAKSAISSYFRRRNAYYRKYPMRAGNKIWGKEIVVPKFEEGQNCKDRRYR